MLDPATLRSEYDLARRYTLSLYEDLSEAEARWRPSPKSSGIAWHLGHQAAVNHFLLRNLIAAEESPNPEFDRLFDAANPEEERGALPPLADIVAYRDAVARRTHAYLERLQRGDAPAPAQLGLAVVPILVSIINHEYQHDAWVREVRAMLGREKPDEVFSRRVRSVESYWVLTM